MNRLKSIRKGIQNYLFDSSIYVKDRTFVVFTIAELLALVVNSVVGLFFGESFMSVLASLLGVLVGTVILYVLVKSRRIKVAKVVLSIILVFVLRPISFFSKGGIDNGTLIMFLLGSYYLVLVLDGKFRIAICLADSAILVICGIVAYLHPELLPAYDPEIDYFLSYSQYFIGFIVLTILITFWTRILQKETRKAEEKTKELEEMNKSQSRFFASMSHEIRTPINTVLGLNEIILRQEDASDEIKKDAKNIQGAGKMLLALINDILDVSKIEAGKMDIVPVNYSVSSLLSEIVNMIWLKAEEKGLTFDVDIDPEVPESLFGDEVRIKQILINLLNNSVKYTKEGSVSLHMECEFPDDKNALLKISVSDTGMGIKPEALPHLFDSFQRVDEEKNRHIEGTGLGLSLVKQLVELMDGEIKVSSVYTQGSIFTVILKQGISSDKRIGDINISNVGNHGDSGKYEHCFHAPGARILIVDDNEMNLQVESKLLEGTEMTVDLAMSGVEALSKTLSTRYDVIFMDHLMPEMDGIECYEKIKTQSGGLNRNVPIIVLTANAGGENIELYNNTGFDGYLVKPVSGKQLEDMLVTHLPEEKVINTETNEMTGSQLSTASGYAKKKPVVIATSTMSDLPQSIINELQIQTIPYTVTTDEGTFRDNVDIDSDELIRYMGEDLRMVTSDPPSAEEFIEFFSAELKKAHQIIYITLLTGSSREYGRVKEAAKSFENVSVINSEVLSSGTGILAMIAAKLAKQNIPADKIVQEVEAAKALLECSFVIKSTEVMERRGNISPFVNGVLEALWLKPVLKTKNDKLGVGTLLMGNERRCYEKYIKAALPKNNKADKTFAFITYAGMSEYDLLWIEDMVRQRVGFEHIIFQKASAGITSNCGSGTFGIIYMNKGTYNYNLGSILSMLEQQENDNEVYLQEEQEAEEQGTPSEPVPPEPVKEKKWYEMIPGIDAEAAIKNSGSEAGLETVIKMYFDSFDMKYKELQDYYDNGDWANYTIKIHALKSSSRLVGALDLGNKAEALEKAGKSDDTDYIREHHEDAMKDFTAIRDALSPMFGKDENDLPEIPADTLAEAYGAIEEFAAAMDYDCVKMVLDSVKEYTLPEGAREKFEKINTLLVEMNWNGIKAVLQEEA